MKQTLVIKGELDRKAVGERVERRIQRLARRLRRFPPDAVHLHAVVEAHGSRPRVQVALALSLPSRTLAAQEEGELAEEVIGEAFTELERLLLKEKARLQGRRRRMRAAEGARERWLARQGAAAPSAAERVPFDPLEPHLPALSRFVEREIRWLEAAGDLIPGELNPRDVVDLAVARAMEGLARKPGLASRPDLRSTLLGLAARALRGEVDRLRSERRRAVPVEAELPEVPPEEEVSTLGSEILEFYQPDEELHAESVLPAAGIPTPESAEEARELQRCLLDALAALPASWRQVLVLSRLEGLSEEQVSEATGQDPQRIAWELERARDFLHARMRSAGLVS